MLIGRSLTCKSKLLPLLSSSVLCVKHCAVCATTPPDILTGHTRPSAMIALTVLYLSLGYSLYGLFMEETTRLYKDFRFWLVLISFFVLTLLTLKSYPL